MAGHMRYCERRGPNSAGKTVAVGLRAASVTNLVTFRRAQNHAPAQVWNGVPFCLRTVTQNPISIRGFRTEGDRKTVALAAERAGKSDNAADRHIDGQLVVDCILDGFA